MNSQIFIYRYIGIEMDINIHSQTYFLNSITEKAGKEWHSTNNEHTAPRYRFLNIILH